MDESRSVPARPDVATTALDAGRLVLSSLVYAGLPVHREHQLCAVDATRARGRVGVEGEGDGIAVLPVAARVRLVQHADRAVDRVAVGGGLRKAAPRAEDELVGEELD